jgi:hypothetical protein
MTSCGSLCQKIGTCVRGRKTPAGVLRRAGADSNAKAAKTVSRIAAANLHNLAKFSKLKIIQRKKE